MALNNDTNFPPQGGAPYRLNREWCVGDSLGYINANSENFDDRLISVEDKTNIANTSSPLYKLNNILTTAPIFVPAGYTSASTSHDNSNFELDNRSLNSDTPYYSGAIKHWYSPSFFVSLNGLATNGGSLPNTNILNNVPRTVAVLISVYFNTNSKGNNGTQFYIKKRNVVQGSTTYPAQSEKDNYISKIVMDPTGGTGAAYEAESDVTMVVYLDTDSPGIPNTFSWRISSGKSDNPWATGTSYTVKINLLGYYVQYPSFVA